MRNPWPLEVLLSRFVVGKVAHLPDLAAAALLSDFDSPSLRMLAGMTGEDSDFEKGAMFGRVRRELNLQLPPDSRAAWVVFAADCGVQPYERATLLVRGFRCMDDEPWFEFEGAAWAGDSWGRGECTLSLDLVERQMDALENDPQTAASFWLEGVCDGVRGHCDSSRPLRVSLELPPAQGAGQAQIVIKASGTGGTAERASLAASRVDLASFARGLREMVAGRSGFAVLYGEF
jgi:hypothetical protein